MHLEWHSFVDSGSIILVACVLHVGVPLLFSKYLLKQWPGNERQLSEVLNCRSNECGQN